MYLLHGTTVIKKVLPERKVFKNRRFSDRIDKGEKEREDYDS